MNAKEKMYSYIEEFNSYLEKKVPANPEEVFLDVKEYIFRGGKRIRPLLMFAVGECFGFDKKSLYDYASAIEMFHNFTLIHDDIEDNSKLRRGKPTLHIKHGIPVAINLGDALYTYVWNYLLSLRTNENENIIEHIGNSFSKVVEGQGYELYWIKNEIYDVKEEDYFKMVTGKTASLIATSMRVGALNRYEKEEIYNAGIKIGISFQIIDDYLNLFGDVEKYGKTIGDDISEGKRTLMVIHALKNLQESEKKRLIEILKMHSENPEIIKEAIELIKSSASHSYAKEKAEQLYQEALSIIEKLDNNEFLLYLANLVIKREK